MLGRIYEQILKALTKGKGYLPRQGERPGETKRWLLVHYRKGMKGVLAIGEAIVGLAKRELQNGRERMGMTCNSSELQEEGRGCAGGGYDLFATTTMAKIYEEQGLVREAVCVYERLLQSEPGNAKWQAEVRRLKKILKETEA